MVVCCLFVMLLACRERATEQPVPEIPLAEFREGDLVFRRGTGAASLAVLMLDPGRYSHVGIVVRQGDSLVVAHAVPYESNDGIDRAKTESVADFFRPEHAREGVLVRCADSTVARQAAAKALELADRGVLFDFQYNCKDTTQFYCTEFVYFAYICFERDLTQGKRSRIPTTGGRRDTILPSDILRSDSIKVIWSF